MNGRLRLRLGDLCACPSCPTIARAFRNRFAADVNGPLEHPHVVQRLSVGSTAPEPTSGMAGNGRRVTEVLVRSGSLHRFIHLRIGYPLETSSDPRNLRIPG